MESKQTVRIDINKEGRNSYFMCPEVVLCQPENKMILGLQTPLEKMTLMKTKLPMMMVVEKVLMLTNLQPLLVNKDFILMLQFWKILLPKVQNCKRSRIFSQQVAILKLADSISELH